MSETRKDTEQKLAIPNPDQLLTECENLTLNPDWTKEEKLWDQCLKKLDELRQLNQKLHAKENPLYKKYLAFYNYYQALVYLNQGKTKLALLNCNICVTTYQQYSESLDKSKISADIWFTQLKFLALRSEVNYQEAKPVDRHHILIKDADIFFQIIEQIRKQEKTDESKIYFSRFIQSRYKRPWKTTYEEKAAAKKDKIIKDLIARANSAEAAELAFQGFLEACSDRHLLAYAYLNDACIISKHALYEFTDPLVANIYCITKHLQLAIELMDELIKKHPMPVAYIMRGTALLLNRKAEAAKLNYLTAMKLANTDSEEYIESVFIDDFESMLLNFKVSEQLPNSIPNNSNPIKVDESGITIVVISSKEEKPLYQIYQEQVKTALQFIEKGQLNKSIPYLSQITVKRDIVNIDLISLIYCAAVRSQLHPEFDETQNDHTLLQWLFHSKRTPDEKEKSIQYILYLWAQRCYYLLIGETSKSEVPYKAFIDFLRKQAKSQHERDIDINGFNLLLKEKIRQPAHAFLIFKLLGANLGKLSIKQTESILNGCATLHAADKEFFNKFGLGKKPTLVTPPKETKKEEKSITPSIKSKASDEEEMFRAISLVKRFVFGIKQVTQDTSSSRMTFNEPTNHITINQFDVYFDVLCDEITQLIALQHTQKQGTKKFLRAQKNILASIELLKALCERNFVFNAASKLKKLEELHKAISKPKTITIESKDIAPETKSIVLKGSSPEHAILSEKIKLLKIGDECFEAGRIEDAKENYKKLCQEHEGSDEFKRSPHILMLRAIAASRLLRYGSPKDSIATVKNGLLAAIKHENTAGFDHSIDHSLREKALECLIECYKINEDDLNQNAYYFVNSACAQFNSITSRHITLTHLMRISFLTNKLKMNHGLFAVRAIDGLHYKHDAQDVLNDLEIAVWIATINHADPAVLAKYHWLQFQLYLALGHVEQSKKYFDLVIAFLEEKKKSCNDSIPDAKDAIRHDQNILQLSQSPNDLTTALRVIEIVFTTEFQKDAAHKKQYDNLITACHNIYKHIDALYRKPIAGESEQKQDTEKKADKATTTLPTAKIAKVKSRSEPGPESEESQDFVAAQRKQRQEIATKRKERLEARRLKRQEKIKTREAKRLEKSKKDAKIVTKIDDKVSSKTETKHSDQSQREQPYQVSTNFKRIPAPLPRKTYVVDEKKWKEYIQKYYRPELGFPDFPPLIKNTFSELTKDHCMTVFKGGKLAEYLCRRIRPDLFIKQSEPKSTAIAAAVHAQIKDEIKNSTDQRDKKLHAKIADKSSTTLAIKQFQARIIAESQGEEKKKLSSRMRKLEEKNEVVVQQNISMDFDFATGNFPKKSLKILGKIAYPAKHKARQTQRRRLCRLEPKSQGGFFVDVVHDPDFLTTNEDPFQLARNKKHGNFWFTQAYLVEDDGTYKILIPDERTLKDIQNGSISAMKDYAEDPILALQAVEYESRFPGFTIDKMDIAYIKQLSARFDLAKGKGGDQSFIMKTAKPNEINSCISKFSSRGDTLKMILRFFELGIIYNIPLIPQFYGAQGQKFTQVNLRNLIMDVDHQPGPNLQRLYGYLIFYNMLPEFDFVKTKNIADYMYLINKRINDNPLYAEAFKKFKNRAKFFNSIYNDFINVMMKSSKCEVSGYSLFRTTQPITPASVPSATLKFG